MITSVAQRWRDRRGTYRPAGEVINTRAHEVAELPQAIANAFVIQHHYSGEKVSDRFRFGLYRGPRLVGAAIFSHPVNDRALRMFPGKPIESVELGRLVLLDEVPGNGESWFVARCLEQLRREGLVGVLSMSDPEPRTNAAGRIIFAGHIGNIYQALNGVFLGRATPRTLRVLPDGRVLNARAIQKIRAMETGWPKAVAKLVRAEGDNLRAWLARWLPQRHPGNYRYAWGLQRAARRGLPASLPYPKLELRGAA